MRAPCGRSRCRIVFGYYFFWAVHAELPPLDAPGISLGWAAAARRPSS